MKAFPAWLSCPTMTGVIGATCAMVLYAATVAPTFSWGDSADLAMRLVSNSDQSFAGTHRDYALFRLAGQAAALLPIQDAGLRANLFAAFWGAVTVGAVAFCVRVICRSNFAAFAAAGSLSVAHSFWLLSVIAEVYTFNTALVFLTFAMIVAWWDNGNQRLLWVAAFLAGLSLLHHATGLVLVAAILPLLAIRAQGIGAKNAAAAALIFALTSSTYWLSAFERLGAELGLLHVLGLSMSQNAFFETSPIKEAFKFLAYLTFNFLGIGIIFVFFGAFAAIKSKKWAVLPPLIWAGAFFYAGITSSIPDKFNVYVLIYPSFAILVGIGAAWFINRFSIEWRGTIATLALLLLIPPAGYATAVWVSRSLGIDLVGARIAPLRDNNAYFLWPPKNGDFGPRIFAESALVDLPEGSILIADYTLWRPILFLQTLEALRRDVDVQFVERLFGEGVDNWIARQPCESRVFLATTNPPRYYQLDAIEARFDVSQFRNVYEVERECP